GIISSRFEPGTPLIVTGRVFAPDGVTPAPNVIVYAYQTDAAGQYHNDAKTGTPRLHAWARTDADGRFEFRTIHPGSYPAGEGSAHIRFRIYGGGYPLQWVPDLMFASDPLLRDAQINEAAAPGRFSNLKATVRDEDGTEACTFNIRASKSANDSPGERAALRR
ncbi:MAG TPA: hypothetical protein VKL40_17630, partial [Candidatus Angelobacter sp.]|nr:hypothetical protein [Candidatus Angelobacter sp.]